MTINSKRMWEFCVVVLLAIVCAVIVMSMIGPQDAADPESRTPDVAPSVVMVDYGGQALSYVAEVETFARAVQAHQLTELAAEVDRQKADAERARLARERAAMARPAPAPAPSARPSVSAGSSVWDQIAQCESGGNWAINTGNGYSGGLQFAHSSWTGFGGREFAPMAWQASREQQIVVAERILASQGWGAWPACTRKLGLR